MKLTKVDKLIDQITKNTEENYPKLDVECLENVAPIGSGIMVILMVYLTVASY